MNDSLEKRLKEIKEENYIFVIFIIIIFMAYYANNKEIDYFLNNNESSKKDYYYLMIIIFLIVSIISAYYFTSSLNELNTIKYNKKEKEYTNLNIIASAFALIASLIYLYIAITDTNIDAEISI